MIYPKLNVSFNKTLDEKYLIEFFMEKNKLLFDFYPFLNSKNDCKKLIDYTYKNKINEFEDVKKLILSNKAMFNKIALQLSNILEVDWGGIENITIVPSACPVCPRFIDSNSFLVTYFYNKDAIFRICAHEMSHFLYFKKLKQLYPKENIDTEYPGKDWLLSEIITPLIINSNNIQRYIVQKDEFYAPKEIENIDKLQKNIKSAFNNRKSINNFIINARKIVDQVSTN